MQSALTQMVQRAEIGHYFEEFPLVGAAGQIGLIKEGKTGSFKVTSIINWSAQPKGLPGQGNTRKQLCCFSQPQGSQTTENSVCLCCLQKETGTLILFFFFCLQLPLILLCLRWLAPLKPVYGSTPINMNNSTLTLISAAVQSTKQFKQ